MPTWSHLLLVVRPLLALVCVSSVGFYAYALYAARDFFVRREEDPPKGEQPGISVLKPLRGLDRDAVANFASFCGQDYGCWEILFGAEDDSEPCLEAVRQVAREHPEVPIRIIIGRDGIGSNPKVRLLARLAQHASHPLLLVSDSDIRAGRSHLRRMVAPLRDPRVGVVTCLYRTQAVGLIGKLDALTLSTEFVPAALVARKLEGMSFAMGAGILIRRAVLEGIGGFEALADSLADDYLLGKLPAAAGHRVELARDVVDHRLGTRNLAELGARQKRWNVGIRTSRPWGYAGLVFTQGTTAALLLLLAAGGSPLGWILALSTIGVRLGAGWLIAERCLRERSLRKTLWLVPLRDLLGTLLWLTSLFGRTVVWRGRRIRVGAGGRILDVA